MTFLEFLATQLLYFIYVDNLRINYLYDLINECIILLYNIVYQSLIQKIFSLKRFRSDRNSVVYFDII